MFNRPLQHKSRNLTFVFNAWFQMAPSPHQHTNMTGMVSAGPGLSGGSSGGGGGGYGSHGMSPTTAAAVVAAVAEDGAASGGGGGCWSRTTLVSSSSPLSAPLPPASTASAFSHSGCFVSPARPQPPPAFYGWY